MRLPTSLIALALAFGAAPLSGQIGTRTDPRDRRPTSDAGTIGDIIFGSASTDTSTTRRAKKNKIPPGHLPPRGMCRVWIDGVPPGQQPPVTSCTQAEADRVRLGANARVIYGDRESFRGRANGKFKNRERRQECQVRDGVVVDGRVVNVCSDDRVQASQRRVARADRDDDDRIARANRGKGKGRGKS